MREHVNLPLRIALVVLVLAIVGALFFYAEQRIPKDTQKQAEQSIKASVQNAAVQCLAAEGAYPMSLAHLENKYNLVINHSEYIVTYTCFAANIMPEIEVYYRADYEED